MDDLTSNQRLIEVMLRAYGGEVVIAWHDVDLPPTVERALECIHQHFFDESLNASFVREYCKLRNNNESSRFKRWIGVGMRDYIECHRITVVKRLQSHDSLRIAEIALGVGYSSIESFERAFRRCEHCCPSQFRSMSASGGSTQKKINKKDREERRIRRTVQNRPPSNL